MVGHPPPCQKPKSLSSCGRALCLLNFSSLTWGVKMLLLYRNGSQASLEHRRQSTRPAPAASHLGFSTRGRAHKMALLPITHGTPCDFMRDQLKTLLLLVGFRCHKCVVLKWGRTECENVISLSHLYPPPSQFLQLSQPSQGTNSPLHHWSYASVAATDRRLASTRNKCKSVAKGMIERNIQT